MVWMILFWIYSLHILPSSDCFWMWICFLESLDFSVFSYRLSLWLVLQLFCWHLYRLGTGFSTVDLHRPGASKVHVEISRISFGDHPLIPQAVETVDTIAQSTSHFWHNACSSIYSITTHSWLFSASAIFYSPVPDCSFFYFQSKLSGPPWIASLGAER